MFLPLALLILALVIMVPVGTIATLLFFAATFDPTPSHAVKIVLPRN
jgi:hypothetical protein